MEQENTLIEDVSGIINKIKKDWDRIISNARIISKIDKDILITDLRIAYELATELKVTSLVNSYRQMQTLPDPTPEPDELLPFQLLKEEKMTSSEPENVVKFTPEIPVEAAPVKEETVFEVVQPLPIRQAPVEDPKTHAQQGKMMVDLFTPPKSVSDVLLENGDHSLAAKMQNNRISDIKTAIGINDKFTFINDIFKGEIARYNQGIDRLNSFGNYQEAMEFLQDEGLETGTPENKAALSRLTELIKRRY